jgi:hypothetical protein
MGEAMLILSTAKLIRRQLSAVPTPLGAATRQPAQHGEIIEALVEILGFRHIGIVIYRAFIESDLDAPKHLARPVHNHYFNPQYEEVRPPTLWSFSNSFTSAFKELEPILQSRDTAKLARFLEAFGV